MLKIFTAPFCCLAQRKKNLSPGGVTDSASVFFCIFLAAVAAGQLRDGGGGEPASVLTVQPLLEALSRTETGSGQRSLLWETHPLRLHGPEDSPPRHQVGSSYCRR